jgi:hypothetical protein
VAGRSRGFPLTAPAALLPCVWCARAVVLSRGSDKFFCGFVHVFSRVPSPWVCGVASTTVYCSSGTAARQELRGVLLFQA